MYDAEVVESGARSISSCTSLGGSSTVQGPRRMRREPDRKRPPNASSRSQSWQWFHRHALQWTLPLIVGVVVFHVGLGILFMVNYELTEPMLQSHIVLRETIAATAGISNIERILRDMESLSSAFAGHVASTPYLHQAPDFVQKSMSEPKLEVKLPQNLSTAILTAIGEIYDAQNRNEIGTNAKNKPRLLALPGGALLNTDGVGGLGGIETQPDAGTNLMAASTLKEALQAIERVTFTLLPPGVLYKNATTNVTLPVDPVAGKARSPGPNTSFVVMAHTPVWISDDSGYGIDTAQIPGIRRTVLPGKRLWGFTTAAMSFDAILQNSGLSEMGDFLYCIERAAFYYGEADWVTIWKSAGSAESAWKENVGQKTTNVGGLTLRVSAIGPPTNLLLPLWARYFVVIIVIFLDPILIIFITLVWVNYSHSQSLVESEYKKEFMLKIHAPVFTTDLGANMTEWNLCCEATTGLKRRDVIGMHLVSDLISNSQRAAMHTRIQGIISNGQNSYEVFDLSFEGKNGAQVTLTLNAVRMYDDSEHLMGLMFVGQEKRYQSLRAYLESSGTARFRPGLGPGMVNGEEGLFGLNHVQNTVLSHDSQTFSSAYLTIASLQSEMQKSSSEVGPHPSADLNQVLFGQPMSSGNGGAHTNAHHPTSTTNSSSNGTGVLMSGRYLTSTSSNSRNSSANGAGIPSLVAAFKGAAMSASPRMCHQNFATVVNTGLEPAPGGNSAGKGSKGSPVAGQRGNASGDSESHGTAAMRMAMRSRSRGDDTVSGSPPWSTDAKRLGEGASSGSRGRPLQVEPDVRGPAFVGKLPPLLHLGEMTPPSESTAIGGPLDSAGPPGGGQALATCAEAVSSAPLG